MSFLLIVSAWVPVGLWAGFIYYLSGIPSLNSGLGAWDFFLRKGAHVFEYAVLTAGLIRAFRLTIPFHTAKNILILSGVCAVLYAASDEFHQSFVPGRGPSVKDVLIDSVGIGFILYWSWKKTRE